MSHPNSLIKKHIDGTMMLLLFFIFSLAILFIYLQNVNHNIKNNNTYIVGVVKLRAYNQNIDSILRHAYRYLDNDEITKITKAFDQELQVLENNKMGKSFSANINLLLQQVREQYNLKHDIVERFKTLNARVTSSVYFLYELQKVISHRDHENVPVEQLLSDILFKVGQVFLGRDFEVLHINEDMVSLERYLPKDEELKYFYKHSQQLIYEIKILNSLLKSNKNLALCDTIDTLSMVLNQELEENKQTEETIGMLFFLFALIILIVLVYTYSRVLKNRAEIFYLAYHDTLTKLPNRTKFERYMDELIAAEKKENKRFIVLFIDLDRFKVINDTLGHDVGDEMLIVLSERIGRILGKNNFLARIGGDEFVAIVENEKDIVSIDVLVAEIASTIRDTIYIREYRLNTTASIGIAKYPEDGQTKSMLLKYADSAMYHAKHNGGDTYAFYNEQLSINIQRRLELEQELVYALQNQELRLCYQPQYRLNTGEITGVEALVRWHSDTLGDVSPEEFILVAEDTGLIVELGYFIFRRACEEYMLWKDKGIELNFMAINISSVQLRQADVYKNFKSIIDETGIEAKNIEIELTERYLMEYSTEKLSILDDLRNLGCKVAIDDFGTGYSSMSYLKSLAIDTIKIDKSFIDEIVINKHDAKIVKAMIVLSQSLGYDVIAEGVETLEQENILKSFNCDRAQGYYFGQAMDSEAFIDFFDKKQSEEYIETQIDYNI